MAKTKNISRRRSNVASDMKNWLWPVLESRMATTNIGPCYRRSRMYPEKEMSSPAVAYTSDARREPWKERATARTNSVFPDRNRCTERALETTSRRGGGEQEEKMRSHVLRAWRAATSERASEGAKTSVPKTDMRRLCS